MARSSLHSLPHRHRKSCHFLLAFCWILGLFCGMLVYLAAEASLVPLMRSAVLCTVSITGLLYATILPFLISAFAIAFSWPALILPICFCKALFFSFVSLGVLQAFGSAGWVVRYLLLFSDCVAMPFLYGFWLRHLPDKRSVTLMESALMLGIYILLGSVDYRIISPFLARLIYF